MVVSSSDPVSILPDVPGIVKIASMSHEPTMVVSDKSEDPYTISIVEEADESGDLVTEEFVVDEPSDEQTTADVVSQQLNLGLVDVNKMNIDEMELLESSEPTIMVLQEEPDPQDDQPPPVHVVESSHGVSH